MNPALREFVLRRDDGCVATRANSRFWATRWPMLQGLPDPGPCEGRITLDHVKDDLALGKKAPDDPWHLWSVCVAHHTETRAGAQWATSKPVRAAARLYIRAATEYAQERGWPVWPEGLCVDGAVGDAG